MKPEVETIIALTDPFRHGLAGVFASGAFLALFFGASLKAIAAVPAALVVYAAVLLLTPRRAPAAERMLADGVSEADLDTAVKALRIASDELSRLAPRAPDAVSSALDEMSQRLFRIADHHREDPRDFKHTRRFIRHDLARLVETCIRFVELSERSGVKDEDRLETVAHRIRGFVPALEKIERACVDNDFMRLEVEAEVLSEQIGR